ncbi:MAG: acetyl ornithine aminotransferase family protein [Candidatus Micrarchaeia archaeon]|jgi:4-aminobutyrate aminotransferase
MVKITKRIKDIIERDKRVIMTTTRESYPFVSSHGDGDFVYDVGGNKFIDFSSFISVYNLGVNANKQVRDAVKNQVDRLMHSAFTDYYSELPVKFAENLITMFPKGFGKVFFSNSGTEANEAALKFSKLFTKRQYAIAFYNAFHGRTMGSLSLTASKSLQRSGFGPFSPTIHVPFAYCYRCPFHLEYPSCNFACIDYIKDYPLSKEVSPEEVAAIFIEPIQGEGGYIVPPKDYFKKLSKLAKEHGILIVDDEVQAGYMRTGKFLALENFGVEADIYTMAKSLGAGLPIGATISRNSLGTIPPGAHANTFGGNLVSVAAANASLNYVKRNYKRIAEGVKKRSKLIMGRLEEMKERYEIIGDVRGMGLMIGVEIVKDKYSKEYGIEEREKILNKCFDNGLLLLPAGVSTIRIIPPLEMSIRNIEKGLDIFEKVVKEVSNEVR